MKIVYAKNLYLESPSFYNTPKIQDFIASDANYIMVSNLWDDFGSKTTCFIFTEREEKVLYLGEIRFAIIGNHNTHDYFKNNFQDKSYIEIDDTIIDYYSLGQESSFYEKVRNSLKDKATDFLILMNDISIKEAFLEEKHINDINYDDSILRTSMAQSMYQIAREIIVDDTRNLNFNIAYKIRTFSDTHKISFDFSVNNFKEINNINLLIGENGIGKTQALIRIQNILSYFETNKKNTELALPFGNYIFISNSPFSKFKKRLTNKKNKKVSYTYIDLASYSSYKKHLVEHLINILTYDIKNSFYDKKYFKIYKLLKITRLALSSNISLKILIDQEDSILIDDLFVFEDYLEKISNLAKKNTKVSLILLDENNDELIGLSSGQTNFIIQIFSILDKIRYNSLILIDEPELYLHPNLEITFIRFFREILNQFKSYSIISTHSAVICREVPSEYIILMKRDRETNAPYISPMPFETLGYDLNEIYNYVYDGVLEKKYYEEWLFKYIKDDIHMNDKEFIMKYQDSFKNNLLKLLLYIKNYHA